MTVEQILNEAIEGEVQSYELYTGMQQMVEAEHVKQALRDLANEEQGHKAFLEKMLANPGQLHWQARRLQAAHVEDYKIGDRLVGKPLGPDSTFQDVLIFASRKEQQSYLRYTDLAEQSEGEVRTLLEAMAKDEMRHKNLVESWYEEVVYKEF